MKHKVILAVTLALTAGVAGPGLAQHPGATRRDALNTATTRPHAPDSANAALLNATSVEEFIDALPDWGTVYPVDKSKPRDSTRAETGAPAGATRVHHDIYGTPDKIATFAPVDAFWLGAIVQGRGLSSLGTMQEVRIPADKRAPFTITSTLPGARSVQVADPSRHAVADAIDAMREEARASGRTPVSVDSLKVADNFTAQQTATDLNLDVSYLNNDIQASLGVSHTGKQHTVTVAFIERAYTVTADFRNASSHEAFFNNAFTIQNAVKLVPNSISADNLPAYVKSITYGRMLLFNLTSTASADEMKASVQASLHTPTGAGGSGGVSHDRASQNAKFTLQVTQFGGPQTAFSKAVPNGDAAAQPDAKDSGGTLQGLGDVLTTMQNYLDVPADPDSMIPISYTVNSLKEDRLAAMPVTTSYNVDTYANNPIGAKYRLKLWATIEKGGLVLTDNDLAGEVTIDGTPYWQVSSDMPLRNVHEGGTVTMSDDPDPTHVKTAFDKFEQLNAAPMKPIHVSVVLTGLSGARNAPIGKWAFSVLDLKKAADATASAAKVHTYTVSQDLLFTSKEQYKVTLHYQVIKVDDIM